MPEPARRAPSGAAPEAVAFWRDMGVLDRIRLMVDPTPETVAKFFRIGLLSGTARQLEVAILTQRDVIPDIVQNLALENDFVRPLAKPLIRTWWRVLYDYLTHPKRIIDDARKWDPEKAALLDTPAGRVWLNTTVYNVLNFLRAYGEIRGDGTINPPRSMAVRLVRRALGPPKWPVERVPEPPAEGT